MEGIGSATNLDAALVLPVGMIHRDQARRGSVARLPTGEFAALRHGRIGREIPASRVPESLLHEIPDTPQPRLAEARLAPSGASGEAIAVGLAGK